MPSKSNGVTVCIMVYERLLSLGFSYSMCGAYWYKVAVARTFKRISKQLLEEEQSLATAYFLFFKDLRILKVVLLFCIAVFFLEILDVRMICLSPHDASKQRREMATLFRCTDLNRSAVL